MPSGKYVKDYTLQNTLGPDGRVRATAVYTGPHFRYSASPEALRRSRRAFAVTAAVCAVAAMTPLLILTPIIRQWYVMLPLVFALLPTGVLIQRAATVLCKSDLTRRERDCAASVAPWSAALAILAILSLVGQAACAAHGAYAASDWPVTLSALALAAGAAKLFSLRAAFVSEEIPAK